MKKTLTVNLGGTVFSIDDDAYRLLDNYLENLRLHFAKEEGAEEIVDDIELRISELFTEKVAAGQQVITISDVEAVIAQMGKPEEMEGEEETSQAAGNKDNNKNSRAGYGAGQWDGNPADGQPAQGATVKHHLYRDPDNKMLGGVWSGLALYLGWDVTVIRLISILLLFFSYFSVGLLYLILWIVIPEAQTATEKLNMRGEEVNMENIGKTVTDGFEKMKNNVNDYMKSDKPRTTAQKVGDVIVNIFSVLLKIALVVVALIFSPALFAIAVVLFVMLATAISLAFGGGAALVSAFPLLNWMAFASPLINIVFTLSGILMVGIPIGVIVWFVISLITKCKPMNTGTKWTLLILWLVSVIGFLVCLSQGIIPEDTFHYMMTI